MRILSIDGGGFLGLATATFIAEVERHFGRKLHDSFDLFCGTSTGAIIALALASGMSGEDVERLYQKLGSEVFRRSRLRIFRAKYRADSLKRALEEAFGDHRLDDILKSGKRALVAAFCVTAGTPRILLFLQAWHGQADAGRRSPAGGRGAVGVSATAPTVPASVTTGRRRAG
jgi:predicted acylesterase/phospholipase RssA